MSAKKEKNVKEKKKISLTSMIFIALIAGANHRNGSPLPGAG